MARSTPLLLIVVLAVLPLGVGCENEAPKTVLSYTADAKRAYDAALDEFKAHNWIEAQNLMREVKRKYSYSKYARLAELRIADADYEQEKFADAIREYRQFVHDHRSDADEVSYARSRIAESQFKQIGDSFLLGAGEERDQATILRPLVMDFPSDPEALAQKYEYMFGKSLLVAPVVTAGTEKSEVYLPAAAGGWYDFWTEEHLTGGKSTEADSPVDKIPLFVPAGSILPLGPEKQYVAEKPDDPIELRVYPGKDAGITLYEDEGTNYDYEKGQFSTIPLKWNDRSGQLEIGKRVGSFPTMLTQRTFSVRLAGTSSLPHTVTYRGDLIDIKLK